MPAGFSDAIREIGLRAQINRSVWIELHTDDPGNPNATTPLTRQTIQNGITVGHNGYYGQHVAQGGFIVEGSATTEARYANSADVDFGSADADEDTSGWGTVSWISIWYDADDEDAADPGTSSSTAFDTLLAVMQLQTPQAISDGDPFVIRANTIDLLLRNAA